MAGRKCCAARDHSLCDFGLRIIVFSSGDQALPVEHDYRLLARGRILRNLRPGTGGPF